MSIVRNSIEVVGITAENDIPEEINNGHYVQYSQTETFFIPRYKSPIKNIFQAVINIETNSNRVIKTPVGKTVVIDGTKHIKIIYSEKGHSSKSNIVNIEVPFNAFTEVDEDKEIEKVNVYVLDAYFSLVENRKFYSHMVYMVEFIYSDTLETDDEDKIGNMDFIEDIDGNSDIEEIEEDGLEEALAEPVEDPLVEDISNMISEKKKKKSKKNNKQL